MRSDSRRLHFELAADARGVVYVEYVTVLILVALVGAFAVAALGVPLVTRFRFAQIVLAAPIP